MTKALAAMQPGDAVAVHTPRSWTEFAPAKMAVMRVTKTTLTTEDGSVWTISTGRRRGCRTGDVIVPWTVGHDERVAEIQIDQDRRRLRAEVSIAAREAGDLDKLRAALLALKPRSET